MQVQLGEVESFDSTTATGKVLTGANSTAFPSTCFLSRPARFPRAGDRVEVYTNLHGGIVVVKLRQAEQA